MADGTVKIRVETVDDSLVYENGKICAVVGGKDYIFDLSNVRKIVLLTTDLGPFYDDLGMAIDVGDDKVIFIMSGHECFHPSLFEQIGKAL